MSHAQKDSNRIGEHAAELAGTLKDDLATTAGHLKDGAADVVTQAGQTAARMGRQGYEYAADTAMQAKSTSESFIKKNPWKAVGIAAGVGLLLGLWLRGGRSSE